MIIDSSAWIDFFRRRKTPVADALRRAIADPTSRLMTTDTIRLEVLAGADQEAARGLMNSAFAGCEDVRQMPRADVDDAVDLYQACRRRGETVTSPNDCLIAAIAIRNQVPVLHNDRDFDVIARYSDLQVTRG